MSLTIRDAKLSDAPELGALMYELGYETRHAEMETRLKAILSNPAYKTFVAIMDGCVCAMIGTLTHANHEHNGPSGKIIALDCSEETPAQRYRPRTYCRS